MTLLRAERTVEQSLREKREWSAGVKPAGEENFREAGEKGIALGERTGLPIRFSSAEGPGQRRTILL